MPARKNADPRTKKLVRTSIAAVLTFVALLMVWNAAYIQQPREGKERNMGVPETRQGGPPATGQPVAADAAPQTSVFSSSSPDVDTLLEGIQEVTFDYEHYLADQRPRNPMTPLYRRALSPSPRYRRLSGIIYDSTKPLAVIDGKVVGIGDVLDPGVVVQLVSNDHVVLRLEDSLTRLELGPYHQIGEPNNPRE